MSKIYDNAFKVGVGINILIFTISNIVSYVVSYNDYINREIKFSHGGYRWGFPFDMYENILGYPYNQIGFMKGGVVLNILVFALSGFILGFISQFVWSDITSHRVKHPRNN